MVLLHGFIKKSQATPKDDLKTANNRKKKNKGLVMNRKHIGSNFDDFLAEDATLQDVTAVAVKRVIAWQIARNEGSKNDQDCTGQEGAYQPYCAESPIG